MAIQNVPRNYQFYNAVGNAQQPDFNLDAGSYGITAHAAAWGTATLQRLMPDGTGALYVPVLAALAVDGYTRIGLPAGQYRWVIAGVTTLSLLMEQIAPGRAGGS